jgi:hypothetical protein
MAMMEASTSLDMDIPFYARKALQIMAPDSWV